IEDSEGIDGTMSPITTATTTATTKAESVVLAQLDNTSARTSSASLSNSLSETATVLTTATASTTSTTDPSTTVPTPEFGSTSTISTTEVSSTIASTEISKTTTQISAEDLVLTLLTSSAGSLSQSVSLMSSTNSINSEIDGILDKQVASLELIERNGTLLQNMTRDLFYWQARLLSGFVNTIYNFDFLANHTIDNLSKYRRFQLENQRRITEFADKLGRMQEGILRSSMRLGDKLQLVSRILQQYIKPRVTALKDSFDHLNVSQVHSLSELKNLPKVQSLTDAFVTKLTSLSNQLALLNQTQEQNLYSLTEAFSGWTPSNLGSIGHLLQALIINQKRTDLAIAVCERNS
ncbi:hypothetical protein KR009_008795, partial [Drosophila setifemur]